MTERHFVARFGTKARRRGRRPLASNPTKESVPHRSPPSARALPRLRPMMTHRTSAYPSVVLSCACVAGCGGAEGGAPPTAKDATPDVSSAQSEAGPDGSCGEDAASVACCCDGDLQNAPMCNAGALVCPAGYGLYHGSECSCSGPGAGPCCIAGPDAGPDVRDANGSCAEDALLDSCCCDGDLVSAPSCGGDGALECPAGRTLHHGQECSSSTSTCGPCAVPCPDAGHD